jgi:putative ABC transport system permease protein
VIAALMPALRAARVAPIAVLRETHGPERPLTRLTVAAALVSATGAGLLGFGYAGDSAPLLLGGVCAAFAGITMLTPAVARPAAGLIGWLFA